MTYSKSTATVRRVLPRLLEMHNATGDLEWSFVNNATAAYAIRAGMNAVEAHDEWKYLAYLKGKYVIRVTANGSVKAELRVKELTPIDAGVTFPGMDEAFAVIDVLERERKPKMVFPDFKHISKLIENWCDASGYTAIYLESGLVVKRKMD